MKNIYVRIFIDLKDTLPRNGKDSSLSSTLNQRVFSFFIKEEKTR